MLRGCYHSVNFVLRNNGSERADGEGTSLRFARLAYYSPGTTSLKRVPWKSSREAGVVPTVETKRPASQDML